MKSAHTGQREARSRRTAATRALGAWPPAYEPRRRCIDLLAGASACSACSASSCVAGQYLSGCGGASAGTCAACPAGSYSNTSGKHLIHVDWACWQAISSQSDHTLCAGQKLALTVWSTQSVRISTF